MLPLFQPMRLSVTEQPTHLQRLWLCETIRLREEHAGMLEDSDAVRQARQSGSTLTERIESRALQLARRDGQWQALSHWMQGARLASIVLAVVAIIGGAGLAFAALGDGSRPVNVFWALGSLLGINLLLLLGWLAGLFLARDNNGTLGRLWLWLSEKLARDAKAVHLGPALVLLLQRQRIGRWGLGSLINGWWLLTLLSALTLMLILLATRRYGFVWETTILQSATFISLTQNLGALPALLGFAIPDAELIRSSGDVARIDELARHTWASWLVGVVLVYGLLPRLLLTLFCFWRWRRGLNRLQLDLELPGYSLLRERLQPSSERIGVLDGEPEQMPQIALPASRMHSQGNLLVAIELDGQRQWPPELPGNVSDGGVIDSREQRNQLLDQVTAYPPARLVIACDPRRSPDRGTLSLLSQLAGNAGETRIWLLPPPADEPLDSKRLAAWDEALQQLNLSHQDSSPLDWLEHGHD